MCGAYWLPDGRVRKGLGCIDWCLSGLLGLVMKVGGHHIRMMIKATILLRSMWEWACWGRKEVYKLPPPHTHTHTLHPGRNQQRKQRRGKSEKRACCWKPIRRKTCSQEEGVRGWHLANGAQELDLTTRRSWGFRRAASAELGRQHNPTDRGQGNGRQGALLQREASIWR